MRLLSQTDLNCDNFLYIYIWPYLSIQNDFKSAFDLTFKHNLKENTRKNEPFNEAFTINKNCFVFFKGPIT